MIRTVLLTGANSGMGLADALQLATLGASGPEGTSPTGTTAATSAPAATAGTQAPPAGRAPAGLAAAVVRLEQDARLDAAARRLRPVADATVRSQPVGDALRGTWLGHALHPLLTDFPLGAWASASLLDLIGGPEARRPAQRLIGFGLLAAVPTVASGLAEWQATGGAARRVGVVHAGVNSTGLLLYASSWFARRRARHALGVGLGIAGGVVATLGGYLGGHLTLVRKVGTADPRFAANPSA